MTNSMFTLLRKWDKQVENSQESSYAGVRVDLDIIKDNNCAKLVEAIPCFFDVSYIANYLGN